MRDVECVQFLQRVLPRLRLKWSGYRKVRGQVCKRVARRMAELELDDIEAYEKHLDSHPGEWRRLDAMCRVTISRFYRDRGVFDFLASEVLPELARAAGARGVRCWSVGCASGEEPYTLVLVWRLAVQRSDVGFSVLATDSDERMLERARRGVYGASSVKDLPWSWVTNGFHADDDRLRVRDEFREPVEFGLYDVRKELPDGPFDLIVCRNLVFTYFDDNLQRQVAARIAERLTPDGALVVGIHETLPPDSGLRPTDKHRGVYHLTPPA